MTLGKKKKKNSFLDLPVWRRAQPILYFFDCHHVELKTDLRGKALSVLRRGRRDHRKEVEITLWWRGRGL